jgi:hypothetical protein
MMRVSIRLPNGNVLINDYEASFIIIGRSNKCDFQVSDESLSRTHAQIDMTGASFFITDLGSANGVYLDGTRIPAQSKTQFNYFQQLTIGHLECQVEETSDASGVIPAYPSRKKAESSSKSSSSINANKPASLTNKASTKKKPKKADLTKLLLIVVLLLGVVIFYFFSPPEKSSDANKSLEEHFVLSNVPVAFRDVKDDFSDYLVVYASKGCDKDAKLCEEMNLSTQNGEGIMKDEKEVFVFITPNAHLEDKTFTKVKEKTEVNEIIALYLLLQSTLMSEFDKKSMAQVHLVLLGKDLKLTKVFRFHQKYFSGNEIARMLTDLGAVVDNVGKTEAFWAYANPLIKTKSF